MKLSTQQIEEAAMPFILLAMGFAMLCVGGFATWMALESVLGWLKTGIWSHPSIQSVLESFGFSFGRSSWVVIQAVLSWCLNLPASLVLGGVGVWIASVIQQAEQDMRVAKSDPDF